MNLRFPIDPHNPDERVTRLSEYLIADSNDTPSILVGSSMGGYVSMVCAEKWPIVGAFLLAPALYIDGYNVQTYAPKTKNIEIVHGWSDDIIPFQNSVKFAEQNHCALHLIDGDHRLNASLEQVDALFRNFLSMFIKS